MDLTTFSDTGLAPSTRYWYLVLARNGAGYSPASNMADATTLGAGGGTSGWHDQDIGAVSAAGSFSQSGDNFTVSGSGEDIWGSADEFHYAYLSMNGDFSIVGQITGVQHTDPWAKAGITSLHSSSSERMTPWRGTLPPQLISASTPSRPRWS